MNFKDHFLFEPQRLHRTPEGYLTAYIRVSCAGVFRYLGEDGKTIERVLRPETEIGDPESVNSLNSKPVTLRHPKENVTAENIKKYSVGFTGTDAYFDGIDLWVTITITDPKAIEAVENKEVQAVSCGYDIAVYETNEDPLNNWRGTEYTKVQHGITYNHVALVYAGRAGESVEIYAGDSVEELFNHKNKTGDGKKADPAKDSAMKKIVIDGAVYECDEAVAAKVSGLEKQLDEAAIQKMVDEKIALVDTAKKYGCEVKAEDSALDIKKAVVSKAFGDKMDLKDKNEVYVQTAFDAACIHLDGVTGGHNQSPLANNFSGISDNAANDEAEKAHQAMLDKMSGKAK